MKKEIKVQNRKSTFVELKDYCVGSMGTTYTIPRVNAKYIYHMVSLMRLKNVLKRLINHIIRNKRFP